MLIYIFESILITSFAGILTTILLTFYKPLTKKYFSASWNYYIWLGVLLVMVMPVKINIPVSTEQIHIYENVVTVYEDTHTVIESTQENVTKASPSTAEFETEFKTFTESRLPYAALIWLFTAIFLVIFRAGAYLIFLNKLKRDSYTVTCPEISNYTKRKITTRKSGKISSPLMTGIFKPVLLLPDFPMTQEQLDNVLRHEMIHFKRKDLWYKWFVNAVKCVHWFNPLVYFISRQVNEECEISCDLAVVKGMTKEQKLNYVNTILALLTVQKTECTAYTTGMTGNKKTLKRRFTMIKEKVNISKKRVVISVIVALSVLAIAITAGGLLNGKLLKTSENGTLALVTDADSQEVTNLLLIGTDFSGRADTIVVLSSGKNGVTGLSIPRDTTFEEHYSDKIRKISDLLAEENGDQRVVDAVRTKLSIPVNYYAKINLNAVKEVIDRVGGVEMTVPADMVYEDPHQKLKIDLKAGRHLLNGEQICGLLQYRSYKDGDLTRISMAQNFIKEFAKQKLNKENSRKFPEIMAALENNISTNITPQTVAKYGSIFKNGTLTSIPFFYTLPGKTITTESGINVYETNFADAEKILLDMGYKKNTEVKKQKDTVTNQIPSQTKKPAREYYTYPCEGEITATYGVREHPITGVKQEHNGIDIKAPEGTVVKSSINGTVTHTGYDANKGNFITIEKGGVKTVYAQLQSIDVTKGDNVTAGQHIGKVGKTGTATGAHLHFEIIVKGDYLDPLKLLENY